MQGVGDVAKEARCVSHWTAEIQTRELAIYRVCGKLDLLRAFFKPVAPRIAARTEIDIDRAPLALQNMDKLANRPHQLAHLQQLL